MYKMTIKCFKIKKKGRGNHYDEQLVLNVPCLKISL